jgi:hypothetical protein
MLDLVGDEPERRRADRVRLLLSARLVTSLDEYPVTLRDISLTGAMVEGARLPAAGVDVILKRGTFEIFSLIVWVDGRRAGLEFETPLAVQDLVAQFTRTAWAPTPPKPVSMRRPSLAPEPMTASDWEAVKAWAVPVGRQAYRD